LFCEDSSWLFLLQEKTKDRGTERGVVRNVDERENKLVDHVITPESGKMAEESQWTCTKTNPSSSIPTHSPSVYILIPVLFCILCRLTLQVDYYYWRDSPAAASASVSECV